MPNAVATKKTGCELHLDGALMCMCWLFSVAVDTVPGERLLGCSLVPFRALALCAPSAKNMFPLIFTPPSSWPPSDLDSKSPSQGCLSWPSYLLLLLTIPHPTRPSLYSLPALFLSMALTSIFCTSYLTFCFVDCHPSPEWMFHDCLFWFVCLPILKVLSSIWSILLRE